MVLFPEDAMLASREWSEEVDPPAAEEAEADGEEEEEALPEGRVLTRSSAPPLPRGRGTVDEEEGGDPSAAVAVAPPLSAVAAEELEARESMESFLRWKGVLLLLLLLLLFPLPFRRWWWKRWWCWCSLASALSLEDRRFPAEVEEEEERSRLEAELEEPRLGSIWQLSSKASLSSRTRTESHHCANLGCVSMW